MIDTIRKYLIKTKKLDCEEARVVGFKTKDFIVTNKAGKRFNISVTEISPSP